MNIALLNVRITFQKNIVIIDESGNHLNEWKDAFSCAATISGESGRETVSAGTTVQNTDCAFTVRWCADTAQITEDKYRIFFKDEIYNIVLIDHLNYKNKAIKFLCRKESAH